MRGWIGRERVGGVEEDKEGKIREEREKGNLTRKREREWELRCERAGEEKKNELMKRGKETEIGGEYEAGVKEREGGEFEGDDRQRKEEEGERKGFEEERRRFEEWG